MSGDFTWNTVPGDQSRCKGSSGQSRQCRWNAGMYVTTSVHSSRPPVSCLACKYGDVRQDMSEMGDRVRLCGGQLCVFQKYALCDT